MKLYNQAQSHKLFAGVQGLLVGYIGLEPITIRL